MERCWVSWEAKTITLVDLPVSRSLEDAASRSSKLPLEYGPSEAPTTNSSGLRCNSPDETSDGLVRVSGSSGFTKRVESNEVRNAANDRRRPSDVGIDCLHPIERSLQLSNRFPPH